MVLQVLTMADLGYDENTNQLYIKHKPGLTTQKRPEPDYDNDAKTRW